jgi:hypothetical protein
MAAILRAPADTRAQLGPALIESTGTLHPRYRHAVAISAGEALGTAAATDLARFDGRSCRIDPGLTDAEITRIENEFGFEFADDHRAFLAAALPLSIPFVDPPGVISTYRTPWPDWRNGDPALLRDRLNWPIEGVLFDVEHNAFWDESWAERPPEPADALDVARRYLADVPQLVPIYGHRYLPAGRGSFGHLVMSVWQTDIICYGTDLVDYIEREFGAPPDARTATPQSPRPVPVPIVDFWREFL